MKLPEHEPVEVMHEELTALLRAANMAADAAAVVTMSYFRQVMDVTNKAQHGEFDPVTEADRLAEVAIRDILQREFPRIGFYGEEHDAINSSNGLLWVVDPIDGTRAFMSGMPLWGTLIGLYNGREVVLGLMDQPFLKERYTGSRLGSVLESASGSRKLRTRATDELSSSTLYCTTPDMFATPSARHCFSVVKQSTQLTRYGGDCYAYALLASGYVDIVLDCDLKPYDIQALIPVVEQAGGVVTDWQGNSAVHGGYIVACGSKKLYEQVLPLLAFD